MLAFLEIKTKNTHFYVEKNRRRMRYQWELSATWYSEQVPPIRVRVHGEYADYDTVQLLQGKGMSLSNPLRVEQSQT